MHFVYIIQSIKDLGYYIGITQDLKKRLAYHNNGRVRSTKHRKPFKLIYSENYLTRREARDREKFFKSYKGSKEKLSIIDNL